MVKSSDDSKAAVVQSFGEKGQKFNQPAEECEVARDVSNNPEIHVGI